MAIYYTYSSDSIRDQTGVVALGFIGVASGAAATVGGIEEQFVMIDLTEPGGTSETYKGGIQSIDKGFTAAPMLIPIPLQMPVSWDIGMVDSGTFTIAAVWFDGLEGRDSILQDLRTEKTLVTEKYRMSPYILFLSNRAYPVMMTGYSSNIVGGQGDIISIRLGLAICSLQGHYGL